MHFVSQAQVDLWNPKKVNTQQQIPQLVPADRKEGQFVEFQMQQALTRSAFKIKKNVMISSSGLSVLFDLSEFGQEKCPQISRF